MDKKEMREYKKMYRRHRKTMIELAKSDADFDHWYLHRLVITKIRHMYEYYSAGNNVWMCSESLETVIEALKHVLDLQDELDHLYDPDEHDLRRLEDFMQDGKWAAPTAEEKSKAVALAERESELYREIYSYIGAHIQYWWD